MKMTACPPSIVPLGTIGDTASRNQIMDIKITLCKDHGDAATVIQRAWRTYKYRENVVESMIVIQDSSNYDKCPFSYTVFALGCSSSLVH